MTSRVWAVVTLLVVATACARRPAVPGPATLRLADVEVPGPPESIVLDLPTNPYSARYTFESVLKAAGVPYGLEGPALDPEVPLFDFAHVREQQVPLGRRRLGEVLDVIAAASPAYRWIEADGAILVRASADGEGLLDRRVPHFGVSGASPRTALEALIAAIDPARPRGSGIAGLGAPALVGPGGRPRVGHNVKVSLTDATVKTVLGAIARSNGALSWSVKYDRAPAGYETATIVLSESGETVTARSPVSLRSDSAATTVQVGIGGPLTAMLYWFAQSTHARIGVEEVPQPAGGPLMVMGMPPWALPATAPALGLAKLMALDSRYEWSEANGHFHVRPKPGVPGRLTLLDETMDGLSATSEPAGAVIDRIARRIGTPVSPAPHLMVDGFGQPSPVARIMAMPISLNLTGPVTIREALDAVSDATDGWMWSVRPTLRPGRPTVLALEWRSSSFQMGLSITAGSDRPPAVQAPPPPRALPPGITVSPPPPRPPQLFVDRPTTGQALRFTLSQLGRAQRVPMGGEYLPFRPALIGQTSERYDLAGLSLNETLDKLVEFAPEYTWSLDHGVYHLQPRALRTDAASWLNQRVDRFDRHFDDLRDAVTAVAAIVPGFTGQPARPPTMSPNTPEGLRLMATSLTIALKGVTVRDVLDEITRQHGAMMWTVERRGTGAGSAWLLVFSGFDGWSLAAVLG